MKKNKVLVVDDEPGIRDTICELLEFNGYEIQTATDGRDALLKLRRFQPDLILCDWMMPGMDGLELLQETRQLTDTENVPFVFISAKSEKENIRLAMGVGADDFITKPFKASDLLDAISSKLYRFSRYKKQIEDQQILLNGHFSKYGFHEFNTPMNSIVGGFDFLMEYNDSLEPAERMEVLGGMRMAALRIKRAYTNLLVYTKINRGESIFSTHYYCSPTQAYEQVLARLKTIYQTFRIDAQIEEVPLSLRIEALDLMLYELLDNAVKFGQFDNHIQVIGNKSSDGKHYYLRVVDQGAGLTATEIASIGPMVQFSRSTREQQGWGLGLYLVKAMCEAYHIEFAINSSPAGTTVSITFPL